MVFDRELRRLVADLTETMVDAPGAGLAAPQIGVGLRVFSYRISEDEQGHLVNPVLHFPSEETQDGPEGCLSIPGLTWDCRRMQHVVAHGQNCYGDPITVIGIRPAGPVRPARDRSPGRGAVRRPAGSGRPGGPRWPRSATPSGPAWSRRWSRSARTPASRACSARAGEAAVRRHPRGGAAVAAGADRAPGARGRRGAHPAGRAGRPGPDGSARPRSAELATEAGLQVLRPAKLSDPDFLRQLAELDGRLRAGGRVRGAAARAGVEHAPARLGEPALLAAAGLARRGAGAARAAARRRHHRRQHVPDRARPGRRPGVRSDDRADPAHRHQR